MRIAWRSARADLKKAYFIGVRDGFRLARANETTEIEEILDDIKNDFGRIVHHFASPRRAQLCLRTLTL
jgi:hypothetical protein